MANRTHTTSPIFLLDRSISRWRTSLAAALLWALLTPNPVAAWTAYDPPGGGTLRVNPAPGLENASQSRFIDHYFSSGTRESTEAFIAEWSRFPTNREQERLLLLAVENSDEERLRLLRQWQPPDSPLLPFLQLALGDRHMETGNEEQAQRLWQEAQAGLFALAKEEAQQRLHTTPATLAPLRVGLLLPMSGQYTAMGNNLLQAVQKALVDYADIPLDLLVEDSGQTAESSRTATEKLVNQQAQVIIGPVFHTPARAAAEVALARNVPIIVLNPKADIAEVKPTGVIAPTIAGRPRGIYLNAFFPDQQAQVMARQAIAERRMRAAIVATESEYSDITIQAFATEFHNLGGEIAHSFLYAPNKADLGQIKQTLSRTDPDSIAQRMKTIHASAPLDPTDPPVPSQAGNLEPWYNFDLLFLPVQADQLRLIAPLLSAVRSSSASGGTDVALFGTALWNRPELFGSSADLQGAQFCDTEPELKVRFRQVYQQLWEDEPHLIAPLAYDSVAILAQLLRDQRAGGPPWQQGFNRTTGFRGVAGPIHFAADGRALRNYHLFQIRDKQAIRLGPLP